MTVEFLQEFSNLTEHSRDVVIAYLRGYEDSKALDAENVEPDHDDAKLQEYERVASVERRLREYVLNGGGDIDTTNFTRDDFQTLGEINARLANR